jgi:hypothetical protein
MANQKHFVITMGRLTRAVATTQNELDSHGIWTERLAEIDVYQTWFAGRALGWQMYLGSGNIYIPAIALGRVSSVLFGSPTEGLRDILRHEYAHAVAHCYRGLIRSNQFVTAFGTNHDNPTKFEYDEDIHISAYAAHDASEDFAEVFMLYFKHSGKIPGRFNTPAIRRKWKFVKRLLSRIKAGKNRWY